MNRILAIVGFVPLSLLGQARGSASGPANTSVRTAPYSADATTETTQTLIDGNVIARRTTQKLFRDSDGRERREESILAVGPLAQLGAREVVTITDPVAGLSYALDPLQKLTRRAPLRQAPALPAATVGIYSGSLGIYGAKDQRFSSPMGGSTQNLGTRLVNGISAIGTRTTVMIPEGQVGNRNPIKIVDETWFSPDLQINVMTSHHDPRTGDTIYQVTNINRANPPRSLFESPPSYKVVDQRSSGEASENLPAPGRSGGPATRKQN